MLTVNAKRRQRIQKQTTRIGGLAVLWLQARQAMIDSRSAMDSKFDLEWKRRKGEIVLTLEALRDVAVASFLEFKTLKKPGKHQEQQIHAYSFTSAYARPWKHEDKVSKCTSQMRDASYI
jgi:hypothetical protein